MAKIPGAVTAGTGPQPRQSATEQLLISLVSQLPNLAFGVMDARRAGRAEQRAMSAEERAVAESRRQQELHQQAQLERAQAEQADLQSTTLLIQTLREMPEMSTYINAITSSLPGMDTAVNPEDIRQVLGAQGGAFARTLGDRIRNDADRVMDIRASAAGIEASQTATARNRFELQTAEQTAPWEIMRQEALARLATSQAAFENESQSMMRERHAADMAAARAQLKAASTQRAATIAGNQQTLAREFAAMYGAGRVDATGQPIGESPEVAAMMVKLFPTMRANFDLGAFGDLLEAADNGDVNAAAEVERSMGDPFAQLMALSAPNLFVGRDPLQFANEWRSELQRMPAGENQQRAYFAREKQMLDLLHGVRENAANAQSDLYKDDVLRLQTALNSWRILQGQLPITFSPIGESISRKMQSAAEQLSQMRRNARFGGAM